MDCFRLGQITDSHLYGGTGTFAEGGIERRDAYYRECLREVAAHNVELIIHTGDLVNSDRRGPYHRRFRALIDEMQAELDIPILICRGNHDASITDEEYREIWGPSNWLVEHRGWRFLGVDRFHRTYSHGGAQFAMSPECLTEVDHLLSEVPPEAPLAVCLHDNPVGISDFWHGEAFLQRIKEKNCRFLLFGHVQGNWVSCYQGIPHYTVVGERQAFDSSPLSYNIITCDGDGGHHCDFHPYRTNTPAPPKPTRLAKARAKVRATGDWLDLRGPARTRATEAELPSTAPALAWQTQLPGGLSIGAPTLRQGVLHVGTKTHGRFEQCAALALDAATGKTIWSRPLDGSAEGGVTLHGSRGYLGTSAGSIYCLDLERGEIAWHWNSGENIPIASAPTYDAAEDVLHAGANLEMYALRAATGTTLWRTTTTLQGCGYFTGGHASPVVSHDRVFHQRPYGAWGDDNRFLISADKQTGKSLVKAPARYTDQAMMRHASPIIYQGFLIAVAHGLWVSDVEQPISGEPHYWREHFQAGATPAAADHRVYVSYHSEVIAHDLLNGGHELWRAPHEPALYHFGGCEGSRFSSNYGEYPTNGTYSSPIVCGDKLLVCNTAGQVRCWSCADGRELWQLRFDQPLLAAPVVSGNALFLGDYLGRLYAFAW